MGDLWQYLRSLIGGRSHAIDAPLRTRASLSDDFEFSAPNHQNAIDLVPGWNHAFPERFALKAGAYPFHEDDRIHWALSQFGSLADKHVLELGPLEGSHTSMLERAGAKRVDAFEANKIAFLRCLIAKEVMELRASHFQLGDFVSGLEAPTRYDMIVACGVLYHMSNPLLLLERMAARTDAIYIWTHYFDESEMPLDDPRRGPFRSPDRPHIESIRTEDSLIGPIRLHQRSYHGAWKDARYCGGPKDNHFWMEKVQIVEALRALGLSDLRFAHEEPNHPNGPAISIFASRSQ